MFKSPLVHFFVIAAVVYVGMIGLRESKMLSALSFAKDTEVVTLGRAELLRAHKENGGNQSHVKLVASINALVDKELLFREGLKLGLASNDALIIDRMVKNIEYVSEQQVAQDKEKLTKSDAGNIDGMDKDDTDKDDTDIDDIEIDEENLHAFFEEAKSLKLFENDPVIHRRVIQLAEQHVRQNKVIGKPKESDLQTYVMNNSVDFMMPRRWSLEQVYVDPSRHSGRFSEVLKRTSNQLANPTINAKTLGDATILPHNVVSVTDTQLKQQFGLAFVSAVAEAPLNKWVGPFDSSFGSHFVRINNVREQQVAELSDVYNRAFLGWLEQQKKSVYHDRMREIRKDYRVSVDGYETVAAVDFTQYWLDANAVN